MDDSGDDRRRVAIGVSSLEAPSSSARRLRVNVIVRRGTKGVGRTATVSTQSVNRHETVNSDYTDQPKIVVGKG
jgi:hypothetical protein